MIGQACEGQVAREVEQNLAGWLRPPVPRCHVGEHHAWSPPASQARAVLGRRRGLRLQSMLREGCGAEVFPKTNRARPGSGWPGRRRSIRRQVEMGFVLEVARRRVQTKRRVGGKSARSASVVRHGWLTVRRWPLGARGRGRPAAEPLARTSGTRAGVAPGANDHSP